MTVRVALGLAVTAMLVGCGHPLRDKGTAADAMDRFHEHFNAGEYGKIYDTAGPEFQSKNVRGDFLTLLEAAHRQLGDYKTCADRGWSSHSFGGDTSVKLRYRTHFERGDADETFDYTVSGTHATLRVYRIESKALNTR